MRSLLSASVVVGISIFLGACGGDSGSPAMQSEPSPREYTEFARHVSESGMVRVHSLSDGTGLTVESLSGWGEYHSYIGTWLDPVTGEPREYSAFPAIFGLKPTQNPIEGAAVWTGLMAGMETGEGDRPNFAVVGNARLEVDFQSISLGVLLHDIERFKTGFDLSDIEWQNVPMENGTFQADGLDGGFYGPNQEEAAATFDKNGISGAFGVRRDLSR